MENLKNVSENENPSQDNEKVLKSALTKDIVKEWVKRDIGAAAYALRVFLRYPDLLDKFASEMYDRIMAEEVDKKLENPDGNGGGK